MPNITANTANLMLSQGLSPLANGGSVKVYTGTQPSSGGGALSGNTLLLTFNMAAAAFGAPSGGTMAAASIPAAVAAATGTATWFRMLAGDGTTVIMDGTVGTSGADLNLATTSINNGDIVGITSFTITSPVS